MLDLTTATVSPAEAAARVAGPSAGGVQEPMRSATESAAQARAAEISPDRVEVGMLGDRPVYRFGAGRNQTVVFADNAARFEGPALGVLHPPSPARFRFRRVAAHSPYAGYMKWHHYPRASPRCVRMEAPVRLGGVKSFAIREAMNVRMVAVPGIAWARARSASRSACPASATGVIRAVGAVVARRASGRSVIARGTICRGPRIRSHSSTHSAGSGAEMHRPYVNAVAHQLPKAEIVFDKFHPRQHAAAALDEVRRQEFLRARAVMRALGRGKRWLLVIGPTTLSRMAMGKRAIAQSSLWVATSALLTSLGHPFYTRLNALLESHDFDRFVEDLCGLLTARGVSGRR